MRSVVIGLVVAALACVRAGELAEGNRLYADGRFAEAVGAYRKALEAGANPAIAWFNLGNAYYQLDSLPKAAVCYDAAVGHAPDFCKAYTNLGVLLLNMDMLGGAVAALEQALGCDADNVLSMLTLAVAYRKLDEHGRAVPLLERAVKVDPSRDECYFLLYDINRELGDRLEAQRWLEAYPDSSRRAAEKYRLLGQMADERSDRKQSIYWYSRLVEMRPDERWGHFRLIQALLDNDATLTALERADAALARFDDFVELMLLAGNASLDAGYLRRAERYYLSAFRLGSSGGAIGIQNLIGAYERRGNEQRARGLARKALLPPRTGG